jgi:hypothetical protein
MSSAATPGGDESAPLKTIRHPQSLGDRHLASRPLLYLQ